MRRESAIPRIDVTETRDLQFDSLRSAADEVQSLLESGYERCGNWSLAQVCRHLCLVQDPSIDGYPKWISLFAFLRPVMRCVLLPRLLAGNSPKGIPTARAFVPPQELNDATEALKFLESVARFQSYQGEFVPHPAFGRLNREQLELIHAAHAAHHLRFLKPLETATEPETGGREL